MSANHHIILRQLKQGDQSALKCLFDEYYQALVAFANSYLHHTEDSKDIVQGIFIHLWENAGKTQITTSLKAYLFTSVKNRCLNQLKQKKVTDDFDLIYVEHAVQLAEPDEALERELKLNDVIAQLPEKIRNIVELKYMQNMRVQDIAHAMNISENTVKTQLQRGRMKIKAAFEMLSFLAVLFLS